ncbi:hypothetical protein [uncultured Sphingomonas sp.]|uniref:hypothetical protein n=1 Tax=uncultured Sphingomonas sp. TaxID=158754 RepID=UPI0035CC25B8
MEAYRLRPIVRAEWERALLVCVKCSNKVGGGFGPKGSTPLAKALRKQLGFGKKRKARIGVAEVKCLGICPKRAVVAIDTGATRVWHVIPAGTDIADVARTLLGDAAEPVELAVTKPAILPDQAAAA